MRKRRAHVVRHSGFSRRRSPVAVSLGVLVIACGMLTISCTAGRNERSARAAATTPAASHLKPRQAPRPSPLNTAGFDLGRVGGPSKATGGDVVLSTSGAALSDCNIGSLRFNGTGENVANCTINGGVEGSGGFTLDHSFVTSNGDGIDPTGAGYKVIEYNKIWRDGTRVGKKHEDGIQFWQGGDALITHNYISGWQVSAIMVKADVGPISNVTIDSNYLNNPTGFFQLYLCPAKHGIFGITVTNNAFAKATFTVSTCRSRLTFVHTAEQRQAAIKAGNASAASWIVWNDNYVADTHAVVDPPSGWSQ